MRPDLRTLSAMALSLNDAPVDRSDVKARDRSEQTGDGESYENYRSMSTAAVLSFALGMLSVGALVDLWAIKIVPVLGIIAGVTALGRIRRAPNDLTGRKPAFIGIAASALFLVCGSGLSWYGYATEVPAGHERMRYDDLKPTAARPNDPPASAIALNGKQVFIKGYMFPTPHDKGVTKFVLCRDNGDCCFGGNPPKSDAIYVHLKEPLDTEFTTRLRHVAGTFQVAAAHATDGNLDVLYRIEADYIK